MSIWNDYKIEYGKDGIVRGVYVKHRNANENVN